MLGLIGCFFKLHNIKRYLVLVSRVWGFALKLSAVRHRLNGERAGLSSWVHIICQACPSSNSDAQGITVHLGTVCTQLSKNGHAVHLRSQRGSWSRSCLALKHRSYEIQEAECFVCRAQKPPVVSRSDNLQTMWDVYMNQKLFRKYGGKAHIQTRAFLSWDFLLTSFLNAISLSVGKSCLRNMRNLRVFSHWFPTSIPFLNSWCLECHI